MTADSRLQAASDVDQSTNSTQSTGRTCGAPTEKGKGAPCKRPAGVETPHPGRGPCNLHGGCLPNVCTHYARGEVYEFLRGQPGAQIPIDPLDASTKAVELAHGMTEYWREQIATALIANKDPTAMMLEGYRKALQDFDHMTASANRAGVADRMVALTERAVDQVTLAFEQTLMAFKDTIDQEMRTAMGKVFGGELRNAEAAPAPAPLELTA